jgi:hypothetical protein
MRTTSILIRSLAAVAISQYSAGRLAAEDLTVSGAGSALIAKTSKKDLPKAIQAAQAAAENMALADGLGRAVLRIQSRDTMGAAPAASLAADLALHSSEFVVSRHVARFEPGRDEIKVELALTVNLDKLRTYLKDMAPTDDALLLRRVHVLTYTVTGMDPDRSHGAKLHEVIISRDRYAQHREKGESTLYDAASDRALRMSEAQRRDNFRARSGQYEQANGLADFMLGFGQGSYGSGAQQTLESEHSSDQTDVAARISDRAYLDRRLHKEMLTVAASDYIHVTDYADHTQKQVGVTNELRAILEGVFNRSGFQPVFYNMRLANLEFASEDDLIDAVLTRTLEDPQVSDADFVAIGLNRLTPVTAQHRFTSAVTYRVIRKRDALEFLPSKHVLGDSLNQASDDVGQAIATEAAVARAAAVLPAELDEAVKRLNRTEKFQAAPPVTYEITITNVDGTDRSNGIKDALRAVRLKYQSDYNSRTRTETIKVELDGRSGRSARAVVEANAAPFRMTSLDERQASLRNPE